MIGATLSLDVSSTFHFSLPIEKLQPVCFCFFGVYSLNFKDVFTLSSPIVIETSSKYVEATNFGSWESSKRRTRTVDTLSY